MRRTFGIKFQPFGNPSGTAPNNPNARQAENDWVNKYDEETKFKRSRKTNTTMEPKLDRNQAYRKNAIGAFRRLDSQRKTSNVFKRKYGGK